MIFKEENIEKEFRGLDLGDDIFQGKRFLNCKFFKCNFSETKFINCRFSECVFENCTLLNLDISQSVFDDVVFIQTKLLGLNWSEIRNFHTKLKFEKSKIQYSTVQDLEFLEFQAIESTFFEMDFINCKLEKSVWSKTDLKRTNFVRCNLKNADFATARNYIISAKENYLNNTKFTYPEVKESLGELGMEVE